MNKTFKMVLVGAMVGGLMVGSLGVAGAETLVAGGANGSGLEVTIPTQTVPAVTVPGVPLPGISGGSIEINGEKHKLPTTPSSTPGVNVPGTKIAGGKLSFKFHASDWAVAYTAPTCPKGKTPLGIVLSPKRPSAAMDITYVREGSSETKSYPVADPGTGSNPDVQFSICL